MEEDLFPQAFPHWTEAPVGVPDYAGIPDAPPVPQARPVASDIEVSTERTDVPTQPRPNVPLAPSQESVARQQSGQMDEYVRRAQEELRFRQQNNLPRRPAFQPEQMDPRSQYLERRFTPQQEQEFAAIERQMAIVRNNNTINDAMKADLLGKLEQRQSTITPHLMPIKKSPFPEGQGIGDAWKNDNFPGAIFTRNAKGEQQVHWDPARPEKLTDAAIVRMAIEQRKSDMTGENPNPQPITEYIREIKAGIEAIRNKQELPADQQEAAAAKLLASVDPMDQAGVDRAELQIVEKYPNTPTAKTITERRGAAPQATPKPSGKKYEMPKAWFSPLASERDPSTLKDPTERFSAFVLDASRAGDDKAEKAARELALISQQRKANTIKMDAALRERIRVLNAELSRFYESRLK